MADKNLEKSMTRFYDGIVDLLISTSIVESGLDIPKANTLIVYKADNFGLAQLHQLRGRIGRSKEKGYAYFTINKDKVSDNAIRRLKALQAMDSLGAGINLANYDLDIRGAGNLLGEEQSGQIIQVGVELYQKLLRECVNDINNIKHYDKSDVQINIKLAILIPEHYIEDLSLRLSIYRKLGEISDPMTMYLNDLTTIPVNLAGLPGISVPSGLTKEKLPLGIQFIANSFEEQSLLSLAYQFEQSIGFENSELNLKESL